MFEVCRRKGAGVPNILQAKARGEMWGGVRWLMQMSGAMAGVVVSCCIMPVVELGAVAVLQGTLGHVSMYSVIDRQRSRSCHGEGNASGLRTDHPRKPVSQDLV